MTRNVPRWFRLLQHSIRPSSTLPGAIEAYIFHSFQFNHPLKKPKPGVICLMAEPSLPSNLKRIDAGFSTYFLIENQPLRQLCDYKSHLLACPFFFVPYWGFSICPNGKKKCLDTYRLYNCLGQFTTFK